MIYTPEINEMIITDTDGEIVATLSWGDEASISIATKCILTNSKDWPNLADAIQSAIVKMEHSTADHQRKVST